jgi:drug/metabolite transporter (DMT)-like permease
LGPYQTSALVVMYLAGSLFALLLTFGFETRVARIELLSGLGVGMCSYLGNFFVLRALGCLPAYSVFPIVVAGPIVLVALFSKFFLGERLNRSTNLGILCGVVAVLLLTLP